MHQMGHLKFLICLDANSILVYWTSRLVILLYARNTQTKNVFICIMSFVWYSIMMICNSLFKKSFRNFTYMLKQEGCINVQNNIFLVDRCLALSLLINFWTLHKQFYLFHLRSNFSLSTEDFINVKQQSFAWWSTRNFVIDLYTLLFLSSRKLNYMSRSPC